MNLKVKCLEQIFVSMNQYFIKVFTKVLTKEMDEYKNNPETVKHF